MIQTMKTISEEQKGYIQLILYSFFAGIVGVFVRLVPNLDVTTIVFFRAFIGSIFIFLVIIFKRNFKELTPVYPFRTLMVGVFQGLSIFLYFQSIINTSVSNAVFLLYTAPIFSVFLAKIFLKEHIEKRTYIGIFLTLVGIIFILNPQTFSFEAKNILGNIMALGSGFFYAAMALTAKPILQKKSGYYVAFWQYAIISLMFLFSLKGFQTAVIVSSWWQLLFIGIVCTGIAFIFFMEGVKKVKAQKVFIITSLEPLVGSIAAILLLKEAPSPVTIIGAVFIIFGVYICTKKNLQ